MPDQFFKLTPGELFELASAKRKSQQADRDYRLQELGQLAAWLLSPYSKKALTVDDFIRPPKKHISREEAIGNLKDMVEDFGLEGGNSDWLQTQG